MTELMRLPYTVKEDTGKVVNLGWNFMTELSDWGVSNIIIIIGGILGE